ncbi:hypothetical protein DH2020_041313 [Rehmannia glutinosa]|uniref:RanBD1 domain-containing protein n=1 Tax=Rehmannia glutinosa TaxID=99300 RepID=A0ABR0UQK9_REHGL
MGDAENSLQPSKKRAAGVQLSRDNPGLDDNEESSELEAGTFKRASNEVLATRRIVKVRRPPAPSAPAAPSASNPFAAIRLVTPASSSVQVEVGAPSGKSQETEQTDDTKSENKVDEPKGESTAEGKTDVNDENAEQSESKVDESKAQPNAQKDGTDDSAKSLVEEVTGGNSGADVKKATEDDNNETNVTKDVENKGNDEKKENGEANAQKNADTAPFSSFQQLSSGQNAFSGITGTGFSSSSFSFGSIPKDGSPLGSNTNSLFGLKSDNPNPTFGFGVSNNENSSIFGTSVANIQSKSEGSKFPPMQEEKKKKAVFSADSVIFEYTDGVWKERGKGELKVNVSTSGAGKARLIMRARGNYRLILNASLFPDMKLTNMDKKGITFACVNSASEGKDGLSTIALKFRDASFVEDFRAAVMEHKGMTLKTPENSPKALDK